MLHPSKGAADGIAGLASVHDPLVGLDELGREKVDHVPLVAALLVHDAAHRLREAQHRPVQADKLRNAARSDLRWDRRVHVRVGDIVVASAREVRHRERFVCRHCIIVVHRNLVVEVDAGRVVALGSRDVDHVEVVLPERVRDLGHPASRLLAAGREVEGIDAQARRQDPELCARRRRHPCVHSRFHRIRAVDQEVGPEFAALKRGLRRRKLHSKHRRRDLRIQERLQARAGCLCLCLGLEQRVNRQQSTGAGLKQLDLMMHRCVEAWGRAEREQVDVGSLELLPGSG
mmetsp:Transcript_28836/g.69031  ORF Transcript_28836/g.69031 Transcript_28836/m.69031 type:complete len:288 (+) Transcript_28836:136-999(+)